MMGGGEEKAGAEVTHGIEVVLGWFRMVEIGKAGTFQRD